ncbi:MAG: NAD(P)/FAD-dependent oxidoreductase, partial [Gammaproteobacteria bacterium]|nr:NAD(P)/FAD-dependent oxidoreductase [Gammaproteobacteria bacterium]
PIMVQPIEHMVTTIESQAPELRLDFRGRMISRRALDQALAREASLRGAHCRCGVTLLDPRTVSRFELATGETIEPRVVIGADGPRSVLGAAIGEANSRWVAARQVTVPLAQTQESTDIFLRAAYRGGYGWLFPSGAYAHIGIGVDHAWRHDLKSLLTELHADLVATGRVRAGTPARLTGGLIPVGGRRRSVGRIGRTPVLLAGDAAGLTNPVTGAGIESAVQSGALAGAIAADWLAGRGAAIEDYEDELASLYDPAHARALGRRRALEARQTQGAADRVDFRRAWIAFPEYWSDAA